MPLEKLVQRILDDARDHGEKLVAEAKMQRLEYMKEAEEEARRKRSEICEAAAASAQMEKQQRITAAVINARKDILQAKQSIIAGVMDRAITTITSSSREDYIDILLAQLADVDVDERGELILSPQDRERVGQEVVDRANRRIRESGGSGAVTLSTSTRQMSGGFILKTQTVEVNCSLDAQIESRREEIEEAIVQILFADKSWTSTFD